MTDENTIDADGTLGHPNTTPLDWQYKQGDAPIRLIRPLTADPLVVYNMGKELLRFHTDGRITTAEDAKPTETAKQVLEAMEWTVQGMLKLEYQRGVDSQKQIIDALVGVADKVIAQRNLCTSDECIQKNEIAIHDPVVIRAIFEGEE
jgi:hypothetical protein